MKLVFDPQKVISQLEDLPEDVKNYWKNRRRYKRFPLKEEHDSKKFIKGMLIGTLIWAICVSVFNAATAISHIFGSIAIISVYKFSELIGFEQPDRVIRLFELVESSPNPAPVMKEGINIIEDMFFSLVELGLFVPRFAFNFLSLSFPILLDIELDIDWLHVSLPYIIRTIFNMVQFVILFLFTNKVRRKIKGKIKERVKIDRMVYFPKLSGK